MLRKKLEAKDKEEKFHFYLNKYLNLNYGINIEKSIRYIFFRKFYFL